MKIHLTEKKLPGIPEFRSLIIPVFIFIIFLSFSCGGPDIRIVNQVKTFGPQWVSLKERLDATEKNLLETEGKFEKHFAEFEDNFNKLRDSIQKAIGDSLKGVYQDILLVQSQGKDSLDLFERQNSEAAKAYYEWEKLVMAGKFSDADASAQLHDYKDVFHDIERRLKTEEAAIRNMVERHNSLFRKLASLFNSPVNFDIVLKY